MATRNNSETVNTELGSSTEVEEHSSGESSETETVPAVNIGELEAKLQTAKDNLEQTGVSFQEIAQQGDMPKMLEAAEAVKKAQKDVALAENAFKAATWSLRAADREDLVSKLKDYIQMSLLDFNDAHNGEVTLEQALELDITGFGVLFLEEGPEITVQVKNAGMAPASGRKVSGTRHPGETSRTKSLWNFQDSNYTSRNLLEQFGGEDGAKALYRYDHWKELGMKFSPGVDTSVKKLARSMGWNEDTDNRILTHLPQ